MLGRQLAATVLAIADICCSHMLFYHAHVLMTFLQICYHFVMAFLYGQPGLFSTMACILCKQLKVCSIQGHQLCKASDVHSPLQDLQIDSVQRHLVPLLYSFESISAC